jgi:DNA-binding transcriptional MerR regulator
MVDYLCRHGIIVPSGPRKRGRGRPREYTFGDVVMLRSVAALLRAGVSVARLRDSLVALRRRHPEITPHTIPARYLVTDGEAVYFSSGKEPLETLDRAGQFTFGFVLEVRRVRAEVLERVKRLAI